MRFQCQCSCCRRSVEPGELFGIERKYGPSGRAENSARNIPASSTGGHVPRSAGHPILAALSNVLSYL